MQNYSPELFPIFEFELMVQSELHLISIVVVLESSCQHLSFYFHINLSVPHSVFHMDLSFEMQISAMCCCLEPDLHCLSATTVHVYLHIMLMVVNARFTHLG